MGRRGLCISDVYVKVYVTNTAQGVVFIDVFEKILIIREQTHGLLFDVVENNNIMVLCSRRKKK